MAELLGKSDSDKIITILRKGISTKETPSEISGRGLGIKAIINAIDTAKGKIEIQTSVSHGAQFKISLPEITEK